nr:MAG TPA: DNA repair protein RAD14/DNA Complex excision repair DNA damage [Caudoviricetes sp.]
MMFDILRKKTSCEKDDCKTMGKCFICENDEDESLFNLFGVKVCEGCYHDIINHMSYRNIDDLMDCDKKQLMKFLNKLVESKTKNN